MSENNVQTSDALVQRIISDAENRAKEIIVEAEAYAEKLNENAKAEAAELVKEIEENAFLSSEEIKRARETLSAIENKKTYLTAKQSAVEKVYSLALEKLSAMKKDEYLALIGGLVEKYAEEGDLVILSESAPLSVNDVLALAPVKKLSLKVEKTGKFDGGIVLSGKAFDKDLSFKAIIEEEKERSEVETSKKLFG